MTAPGDGGRHDAGTDPRPQVGPGSPWAPPGHGEPYGRPPPGYGGYGPPGHATPGFGQPPPGWGQPGYGQPGWGQQGWGQPGWGQPGYGRPGPGWSPPPPPRRPFPWKVVGLVLGGLLAIAVVVVLLLAFFVGPRFARIDVLDPDAVAQGVTRVVTEDWRRQITDVTCPEDQEARPGVRFTCRATVDGRPVQVPVTVVDAAGTYSVGQPR